MFLVKFGILFGAYSIVIAASTLFPDVNKIGTPNLKDNYKNLVLYKRSPHLDNSKHAKERLIHTTSDSYEDVLIFKNSDYFDFDSDNEHHYDTTTLHDQQNDYGQDSQQSGSNTVPIYFRKKHFHHCLRSNENDISDSGKEQKISMNTPNDQQNNESQESQQSGDDTNPISLRKKHQHHCH